MKLSDAVPLIGKQVRVTLAYNDPQAICEGVLLAFCEGGEAQVRDEMGFIHFCWPMLEVEEAVLWA